MRIRVATAVLCLALLSGQAFAGSIESPLGLTVFGGMAAPTGTLAEFSGAGFSVGGSVSYQTSNVLAIEFAAATGQRFGFDESALGAAAGSVEGADVNVLSITGGVRIGNTQAKIAPYGAFGAGLYRVSLSDTQVLLPGGGTMSLGGISENALGINLGGGVENQMTETSSVFGEVRYHMAFTSGDPTTYLPFAGGVRFRF